MNARRNDIAIEPAREFQERRPAVSRALERLVRRETGFLFLRAMAHLRHGAAAWDLVQDTLLRALERPPVDLVPEKLRAWLLVVMRNLAIDGTRRPCFLTSVPIPDRSQDPTHEPDDDDQADWQDVEIEQLRSWVRELDVRQRIVFELYARGASYRQIAAKLGLRAATVGTRIFRAKRLLRRRLQDFRGQLQAEATTLGHLSACPGMSEPMDAVVQRVAASGAIW